MSNVISAVFAFLAAMLWFASCLVRIGTLTYQEPAENPFYMSLRRATYLNASAAFCAGISAVAQGVAILS